ncbi:hypothetical protein C0J52_15299 [Blattella germanica]|nr:hypothetical protein C0J52_15299 [Blattella germanica]
MEDSVVNWKTEAEKAGFVKWYATSAKNDHNIDCAFNNLVSMMRTNASPTLPTTGIKLREEHKEKEWTNCTC